MSGSTRAITLTLSVRDADRVRQELEKIGPAGEAAIARLDAAARAAAGGTNGGMPALANATQQATLSTGRFNQAVTQGGFQLQDFAVQVQGGTSALTAFAQQAPQFLGIFGPGGAIAGAVVAVGALAASFLLMGDNAEQELKRTEANFEGMKRVAEDVTRVLREINELFLTAGERSAAAANQQRSRLIEDARRLLDVTVQRNEGNVVDLADAARERQRAERELAAEEARNAALRRRGQLAPVDQEAALRDRLFSINAREEGLRQDITRQSARIGELQEALRRAENSGVDRNAGEFGPPAPERERARSGGGGGRRGLSEAERDLNDALRERQSLLRSLETPQETYVRRLEELAQLQERLPESQRLSNESVQRAAEQFQRDLEAAERGTQRTANIGRELGLTFSSAFEDAILKGKSFSDVLKGIEQDIARIILRRGVTEPLANALGPLGSAAGSFVTNLLTGGSGSAGGAPKGPAVANGGVFAGGNIIPFARGGVVTAPTIFPMANGGAGLMGEAGPEGILPLRRNSRGQLGVIAEGGGTSISQTINIDARGADAGVDAKIRAAVAIGMEQANARLLAQINRGGSTAKIVGRRA